MIRTLFDFENKNIFHYIDLFEESIIKKYLKNFRDKNEVLFISFLEGILCDETKQMQEFTVSSMNDNVFSNILEILHIKLLAELHIVSDYLIQ